jgi:hypothetical protein
MRLQPSQEYHLFFISVSFSQDIFRHAFKISKIDGKTGCDGGVTVNLIRIPADSSALVTPGALPVCAIDWQEF